MFPATGSTMTAAISRPRSRKSDRRASRSWNGAVTSSCAGRVGDRGNDARRRVTEDQRPPGTEEVEIRPAVDVPDAGALTARDEERLTADAAKRPDRAVDAAGNQTGGGFEEALRVAHQKLRPSSAPMPNRSQSRPAVNESRSCQRQRAGSSSTWTKSRSDALQRNPATASARPAITEVTR